jgi:hypothetical protein
MKSSYMFFAVFVVVGLGVTAYGLVVVFHARRTAAWPTAEGVVTRSEVVRGNDSYAPAVTYSYAVDGVRHQGTVIAPGPPLASTTDAYARRVVERYPVGAVAAVSYDPAEPASAVLEPGVSKKTFVPLAFGLLFASIGGWSWVLWWLCGE